MLNRQQEVVLPHLCRLIGSPYGGDLSDRDLLERFLAQRDAGAFAALVRRHGPMVLGVCQRILHNIHDAEDASQATFLVLVRKGRSIARREAVGSFLYGVAYRVALKARANVLRRQRHERNAARRAEDLAAGEARMDDLRSILDEEINRLPEKYRQPIVLCYFEGKTYQEAARLLGCPAGTASVRLARARELLRTRLVRRGLALSAAALVARLTEGSASAGEVGLLAEPTAHAALAFAAHRAADAVSPQVLALTEGVVQAMMLRKLKTLAGVFLAVSLLCGGAGALWHFAGTSPATAADPPRATPVWNPDTSGGRPAVATESPAAAQTTPPARSTIADPFGPGSEAPATAPPPRALAPPAGEGGARPPQTRIGLINITRVIKVAKRYQAMQAVLRARTRQVQEKLELLQVQAKRCQAEAVDPTTPASRRDETGVQARRLKREIEDEQESARKSLDKMSGDGVVTLYREIEETANRLAKSNGLELVLYYTDAVTEADFYNPDTLQRKMSQPGALVPMIVAPGMDITDTVIEVLNRAYAPSK
jgi:RNA polymerase sigma factor (sigma-70 family)